MLNRSIAHITINEKSAPKFKLIFLYLYISDIDLLIKNVITAAKKVYIEVIKIKSVIVSFVKNHLKFNKKNQKPQYNITI